MPIKTSSLKNQMTGTVSPTFAGARDATSGTAVAASSRYAEAVKFVSIAGFRANTYSINRYFIEFDTSGITVAPADATLSIYGFSNSLADIFAVKATFSDGTIANGDFDAIDGWTAGADNSSNVTKYSSEVTTWSTTGFNDITLNSDALSDIGSSGTRFKICLIQADHDLPNNDVLSVTQKTGLWRTFNTIHLDYTEGTAGFGHKTIGVASANIGKINAVATANIGKVIGVD